MDKQMNLISKLSDAYEAYQYKDAKAFVWKLKKTDYRKLPSISEEKLINILEILSKGIFGPESGNQLRRFSKAVYPNAVITESQISSLSKIRNDPSQESETLLVDIRSDNLSRFGTSEHLTYLVLLEKCFEKSKKFTFEKATQIFLEHIEGLKKLQFDINLSMRFYHDLTPIEFAAMHKSPALLNAIIKAGSAVNWVTNAGIKFSPISLVFLNKHQSDVYISYRPNMLAPFMIFDFSELQIKCLDVLLNNGSDPNSLTVPNLCYIEEGLNHFQMYPLWHVMMELDSDENGHSKKMMKSLVSAKGDINYKNNGLTTLQYAITYKFEDETIKFITELKADLFEKDFKGDTAADLAKKGNSKIYKYLKDEMKQKFGDALLEFIKVKALTNIVMDYDGRLNDNNQMDSLF